LAPGEVFSVPGLAARFGVSVTPVREAMIDLVHDGIVEAVPNRGFRIVVVDAQAEMNVADVRMLLEPAALTSIIGRLTPLTVDGLRASIEAITEALDAGDEAGAERAAWAYRDHLLGLCPNPVLVETLGWLRERARPGALRVRIDYGRFAKAQHTLIDDLVAGDVDKVRRWAEYDVDRFRPHRQVRSPV
jgi:DNA-binding GntR family transcriptional regulator